jgi:hypothetical protein
VDALTESLTVSFGLGDDTFGAGFADEGRNEDQELRVLEDTGDKAARWAAFVLFAIFGVNVRLTGDSAECRPFSFFRGLDIKAENGDSNAVKGASETESFSLFRIVS